jgi:hypothetical protein
VPATSVLGGVQRQEPEFCIEAFLVLDSVLCTGVVGGKCTSDGCDGD